MFNLEIESGNQQLTLEWDAIASASGYYLYRSDVVRDNYSLIDTIPSNSYIDKELTNDITYTYYLDAYSDATTLDTSNTVSMSPSTTYSWTLPTHVGSVFYGDETNKNREFYVYSNLEIETVPSGTTSYILKKAPTQPAPIVIDPVVTDTPLVSAAMTCSNVDASGKLLKLSEDRVGDITTAEMQERDYYDYGYNDFTVSSSGVISFTSALDTDVDVYYETGTSMFNDNSTININPMDGNIHTGFVYIDDIGSGDAISLKQTRYYIPSDGKASLKYIATLRDDVGNRSCLDVDTEEIQQIQFDLILSVSRVLTTTSVSQTFYSPITGTVTCSNSSITNIVVSSDYIITFDNALASAAAVRFYFKTTDDTGTLEVTDLGTSSSDTKAIEYVDRYGQAVTTLRSSTINYGDVCVKASLVTDPTIYTISQGETTYGGASIYEMPFRLDGDSDSNGSRLDDAFWLISEDMYNNFYNGTYDPALQGTIDAFDISLYDESGNYLF